jgi:hypothetical protein
LRAAFRSIAGSAAQNWSPRSHSLNLLSTENSHLAKLNQNLELCCTLNKLNILWIFLGVPNVVINCFVPWAMQNLNRRQGRLTFWTLLWIPGCCMFSSMRGWRTNPTNT